MVVEAPIKLFIPCEPMGAPRQSSSDRWKQRPKVVRYRAYKDLIRNTILLRDGKYIYEQLGKKTEFELIFYLPLPKSASRKKRAELAGRPHDKKPDIDNLIKAIFDIICEDDKHIWKVTACKFWAEQNTVFSKKGVQICGY